MSLPLPLPRVSAESGPSAAGGARAPAAEGGAAARGGRAGAGAVPRGRAALETGESGGRRHTAVSLSIERGGGWWTGSIELGV